MGRNAWPNARLIPVVLVVALAGVACSSGGGSGGGDAVPAAASTTVDVPAATTAAAPTTEAPGSTTTAAAAAPTTEAPGSTTTAAPAVTTVTPATTTEPSRQPDPALLARFHIARLAHEDGDMTFAVCAAGVLGPARAFELVAAEPGYEELQVLEGCMDSYEAALVAAAAVAEAATAAAAAATAAAEAATAEAARLRASIPTDPPGTTVECSDADGYRYCVAAGAPVAPAGIDAWGMLVGYTPEVFCTTDMDDLVCERVTKTLLVGIAEWGSYGPLEYWVMGADWAAAMTLIGVQCDRRAARGQLGWDVYTSSDCVDGESQGDYGMITYQRTSADAVVAGGGLNAGLNGNRDWGIHYFTSSLLLGLSDFSMISGRDDQKVILHEYFHAVQHAQFSTTDFDLRDELLGPTWFVEGGAEFMASAVTKRLSASGVLPEVNVEGRHPYVFVDQMRMKVVNGLENRSIECPGVKIGSMNRDLCYGTGYDMGVWAHAWLANRFGADQLTDVMFPRIEDLGWEGAFANAYGMSSSTFYDEFEEFLTWPIADQMAILP